MAMETPIRSAFVRAVLIAFAIAATGCRPRPPRAALPRFIAHAMGEVDGQKYTNSVDAWSANYGKGCRLFEIDLWITSDRQVVAFHDGLESRFGLPRGFSHDEFMGTRIFGQYRPLDSDGIARLLSEKRDWKVVTDTKSDLGLSLEILCRSLARRGVPCTSRVIPQIYRETDLPIVERLGFRQVIFTIYLGRLEDREIVKIARAHPQIVAVTMPPPRANEAMVKALRNVGVRVYVHTVNGAAMSLQFRRGIWGVYTDDGCGSVEATSTGSRYPERSGRKRRRIRRRRQERPAVNVDRIAAFARERAAALASMSAPAAA